jgi:hypothetical protein
MNRLFIGCLFSIILSFYLSCHKSPTDIPPDTTTPTETFGTFLVKLQSDTKDPQITTVLGIINDGPVPPTSVFDKKDSVSSCVLFKTRNPFCDPPCGSNAECVEDDSCQPYPNVVDAGLVTVKGMKILKDAGTSFTMDYIAGNYQSPTLELPPCAEGDTVTFTVAGKGSVPACTLTIRGIKPLKLLTDTFPCVDGQPLQIQWELPGVSGISRIHVLIDISYHGGSKGKIEGDCEDNGSLTIAASLLDKLKSYGISGFPKIEIYRRSTSVSAAAKIKVVFESKIVRFLSIPGIISCNSNVPCPEGQYCGPDQRCHPK